MSPEPTERDVEALTEAERGHAYEHFDEDDTHMGRCYLESDVERILAERIAQARRESWQTDVDQDTLVCGTCGSDVSEGADEPTARSYITFLRTRLAALKGEIRRETALEVLGSEWLADRDQKARREGAAEAVTRVDAVIDAFEVQLQIVIPLTLRERIRTALRGDA